MNSERWCSESDWVRVVSDSLMVLLMCRSGWNRLCWRARGNFSSIIWIYFLHPSGKKPTDRNWQRLIWKAIGWTVCQWYFLFVTARFTPPVRRISWTQPLVHLNQKTGDRRKKTMYFPLWFILVPFFSALLSQRPALNTVASVASGALASSHGRASCCPACCRP